MPRGTKVAPTKNTLSNFERYEFSPLDLQPHYIMSWWVDQAYSLSNNAIGYVSNTLPALGYGQTPVPASRNPSTSRLKLMGVAAAGIAALAFGFDIYQRFFPPKWDSYDQVYLITGASSGIGRSLSLKLASMGVKLALVARREAELNEVVHQCNQIAGRDIALAIIADVSIREANQKMVQQTVQHFGRLDGLVLNAGISAGLLFEEVNEEGLNAFEKVSKLNYFGPVYATHYALPEIIKSRGRIVVVSSTFGIHAGPTRTFYCGSKHALHGFFDALRLEVADRGVLVHMICPGPVRTDIANSRIGADGGKAKYSHFDETKAITPEEAANLIVEAIRFKERIKLFGWGPNVVYYTGRLLPSIIDWLFVRGMRKLGMLQKRTAEESRAQ